ncbi:MAG TPA: carboxymuconolactone decarboxylase family protein [Solirubrobacteraceae bacterium]|nr:carboxymuconolactone decarboxylase family protein [Solirubrobacteraceae bacterium]
MPRLPYYDPSDGAEAIAKVLSRTPLTLLRMVANAESAFEDWLSYSNSILTVLELDPALRELAILQVAHLERSQYEWVQHVAIGQALGVTSAQIAAIERDDEADSSFNDDEASVLRLARAFVLDGTASEDMVLDAQERIGARGVVELLLVLGHYMAIARFVASTGLEPQAPILEQGPIPGVTT